MRLLAIDPGVKKRLGWAWFNGDQLLSCGTGIETVLTLPPVDLVVVELPCVYPHTREKIDPNDLIRIAFEAGRSTKGQIAFTCLPRQWKGTVPKEIHQERLRKKIGVCLPLERLPKTQQSHAIDAIGLGLWYLENVAVQRSY